MTTHLEPQSPPTSPSDRNQYSTTVNRLAAEFKGLISAECINIVVTGCLDDLSWTTPQARPELSERLARQRIISYLDSKADNFN